MKTRLNIAVTEQELALLRAAAPRRGMGSFIREAALEKARQFRRDALRRQIVEAYEADPDFLRNAGREWDHVSTEGWPEH